MYSLANPVALVEIDVFSCRYGRINTCYRLLETLTDTRLLNEGDEGGMTPLHLASRNGHVRVVELLLCRGALCQRQESHLTATTPHLTKKPENKPRITFRL